MWNFDKIKAPKLRRYQPYNNQSNNSIIISWYIPYYSARMPKQNFLLCWWYFYNIENQSRFGCRAVFYLYVSIYAMYAHNPALIVVLFANLFVTYIYITFISNTLLYSWRKQSSSVRWCWAVHLKYTKSGTRYWTECVSSGCHYYCLCAQFVWNAVELSGLVRIFMCYKINFSVSAEASATLQTVNRDDWWRKWIRRKILPYLMWAKADNIRAQHLRLSVCLK